MEQTVSTWWENLSGRRVVGATLVVAAIVAAFYLLLRFHEVVIIAAAAVIVGTAARLLVGWLQGRGLSRGVAVALIYTAVLVVLGLVLAFGLPLIVQEFGALQTALLGFYTGFRELLSHVPNLLVLRIADSLPAQLPSFADLGRLAEGAVAAETEPPSVMDTIGQVVWTLFQIAAGFLLAVYWTLEGERIQRSAVLLVPMRSRDEARDLLATLEEKVGRFVFGEAVLAFSIFALSLAAYLLIGLPRALPLAMIAGLFEVVPSVGPILGAIPAILVALTVSPEKALWVVIASIIIQQAEGTLLVPRVMSRAVGVGPLLTILAIVGFGSLFGVAGALIAVPLAAILQVLLDHFLLERKAGDVPEDLGRGKASVLRVKTKELSDDIRSRLRDKDDEVLDTTDKLEDAVESLALDLELLLADEDEEGNGS